MRIQQDLNQVVETLLVLDKLFDEPLVLDEQLVQHMITDELVLHMVVVVEEIYRIVEQLVKAVEESLKTMDGTEMDCTKVDDCYSMEVCCSESSVPSTTVVGVPGTSTVPYLNGPLRTESRRSLPCSLPQI
ncbi:hypothetical protein Tco_1172343 [Tanacetum coccineum]